MLPEIENEFDVFVLPDYGITLTNYRIIQFVSNSESDFLCKTIAIPHISSCGVVGTSKPFYLGIAAILTVLAMIGYNNGAMDWDFTNPYAISAVLSMIFVVMYFTSRKKVVKIASSSAAIVFASKALSRYDLLDFVSSVQRLQVGESQNDTASAG